MEPTVILGVHGTLTTLAIAAYYRFGDRSSSVEKVISSTDESLRQLRRKLADELARHLEPVFRSPGKVPSIIVSPSPSYSEQTVNPVGSEEYREAFRDFAESAAETVADYRLLLDTRNAWFKWARRLSWGVFVFLATEIVFTSILFVYCNVLKYELDSRVALVSLTVPGGLFLFCLACLPFLNSKHDTILECRKHHDTT